MGYMYGDADQKLSIIKVREVVENCIDFYCSVIELQQEAIFGFLQFWNKTTRIRGVGKMIAKMVWATRCECLVKEFDQAALCKPVNNGEGLGSTVVSFVMRLLW